MEEYTSNNLISVIVPIYNSQLYLKECINSLINQTFNNLEIVLVDDGSTDGSGLICDTYAAMDERIQVIHKKNEGLVLARKTGMDVAKGKYVTFVDSDDYIELNAYEQIIDKMGDSEPDMVLFGLIEEYRGIYNQKINHIKEGMYLKNDILELILPNMLSYGNYFEFGILPNLVCKLIKREFLSKVQLNIDKMITVGEDAAHTFQLIPFATSIISMDYAPYHYCRREDSMMWKEIEWERVLLLEKTLRDAFEKAQVNSVMEKQLKEYISFVTLLKSPDKILSNMPPFNTSSGDIALYGAGGMGQAVYEKYKDKITIWVDKNYIKSKPVVKKVDFILDSNYSSVFISILNLNICKEVAKNLREKGIDSPIYYYDGKLDKVIEFEQ